MVSARASESLKQEDIWLDYEAIPNSHLVDMPWLSGLATLNIEGINHSWLGSGRADLLSEDPFLEIATFFSINIAVSHFHPPWLMSLLTWCSWYNRIDLVFMFVWSYLVNFDNECFIVLHKPIHMRYFVLHINITFSTKVYWCKVIPLPLTQSINKA